MPSANTTIDARASLRESIDIFYRVGVHGSMWSTLVPAKDKPDGLRSADADNWQITLEDASRRMARLGYQMAAISLNEADEARRSDLNSSVVLLVQKATQRALTQQRVAIYLGAGLIATVVIGAAIRKSSKSQRR